MFSTEKQKNWIFIKHVFTKNYKTTVTPRNSNLGGLEKIRTMRKLNLADVHKIISDCQLLYPFLALRSRYAAIRDIDDTEPSYANVTVSSGPFI